MSKTVIISIILFLVVLFGFAFISNRREEPKSPFLEETQQQSTSTSAQTQVIDKQASFAIFTNGTFRVFTASMYHNLSPDVYIEASNPNIVKVKKAGLTWNNFFSTLSFKLTSDCLTTGTKETFCTGNRGTLKFYLNGERNGVVLDQEIQNGDKLLVTFGTESEEVVKQQIDKIPQ